MAETIYMTRGVSRAQIKTGENNLGTLVKQDQDLLDDVDTVEGTVRFEKISLWEMAYVYLGGAGWIMVWASLLGLVVYLFRRNKSKLDVVPVQ